MAAKKISRRDFLRDAALTAGIAMITSCRKAPAVVKQVGEFDLSKPDQVGQALEREGALVNMTTWGFSGLIDEVIPTKFAEYTVRKYGVPVQLVKQNVSVGTLMLELPTAGKHARDADIDVMDNEEEYTARFMALEWGEPIDQEQYKPLLENVMKTEEAYFYRGAPAVNGGDIYGVMYQGYEWLQAILRKDKVDVNNYKDWTDLARPEMVGRGIDYAFNDSRGHFVFMGILNSLIKQGIVKGELWSEPAWEAGIEWWRDNMEDKILKWGDMGNDPTMRMLLQTGEAYWGGLWGVYTRELLGIDWNQQDDVLSAFYPKSGILSDREMCKIIQGCAHPIAARVLTDWMVSTEFIHGGWYKEGVNGPELNRWNLTKDKYLVVYAGGVNAEQRQLTPDWAKPFHPSDPGSLVLLCDWEWYSSRTEWISKTYDRIVKGQ
jgi:ABC-type Fe3+ transport system substrate-binding protein